ncbi:MAG: ribonuclease toxin brnt of type ii toxin-antitoxin system [Chthoniobacteraceae bacterium]|nr:ribonuclease toxin brnt of type ii toxin-antitoxin system [Chthoniobacteraceae bacterium]MDB6172851.1 ribonuclease toxin brnt of type ii toxin-antitoxin system [Chthoniobacteraceae bacterium]
MEFDWLDASFNLRSMTPKEIEESFEDPFSIRLMPENAESTENARYFNLGKSVNDRGIFSVFWTDGKRYRVILARDMAPEELAFFTRKNMD